MLNVSRRLIACETLGSRHAEASVVGQGATCTPCPTRVKALHVPGVGVCKSLVNIRLGAGKASHVARIDSIVLRSCDATNRCLGGAHRSVDPTPATTSLLRER